ncbi:unnamed protein product [Plutella xylostella]|uniref:(diamondback moth) hypothetical protein n=1 Tax=Plutella xylostella TaxID=51655 RepID=A0A8S4DMW9_PLUXY|nr:unnamed protein product [Plutella xylostella]
MEAMPASNRNASLLLVPGAACRGLGDRRGGGGAARALPTAAEAPRPRRLARPRARAPLPRAAENSVRLAVIHRVPVFRALSQYQHKWLTTKQRFYDI